MTTTEGDIAQRVAGGLGPATDEEVRIGFVNGSVAAAKAQGGLDLSAIAEASGAIFDQWLADRDTDIFGEGYDTGHAEGLVEGWNGAARAFPDEEGAA